jgi:hypothetical protein
VEVWCKASSPDRERRWLILLGGMVVFELRTQWVPNVGI